MENLIEKILAKFGYVNQIKVDELLNEVKKLNQEKEQYFAKPELNTHWDNKKESWHEHWQANYAANYIAYSFKHIVNYPNILRNFLYTFSQYDWKDIENFMKETKWYWGDEKTKTPNILELQETVIELFKGCLPLKDNKESAVSSGGFTVTVYPDDTVKIEFKKSDAYLSCI